MAKTIAAPSAKVLVKASGRNNFPSAPSSANTGKKLTMVVSTAATTAEPTSAEPSYTVVNKSSLSPWVSNLRTMFSDITIPTSTMVPMAIAMPESATMLASTPNNFITIKVINTAMGKSPDTTREARRLNKSTMTTMMVVRIS